MRQKTRLLTLLVLLAAVVTGAWAQTGLTNGLFSVSATKKVHFSKGNLQLVGENTFQFAENQWDYFGSNQSDNHRDLFSWGSGNNPNLTTGNSTFTDWGDNTYLQATLGKGWRTMTRDEFVYVFNTRASGSSVFGIANGRYTTATINTDGTGVKGIILFPDGITIAASEVTTAGAINSTSTVTQCTTAQWAALAGKGCVFLPAAGYFVSGGAYGYGGITDYWTSTAADASKAYNLGFNFGAPGAVVNTAGTLGYNYGCSVRLVIDEYVLTLADGTQDADKWTVKVGDGEAQALPIGGLKGDGSETVTLQYNGRLKVKGVKATSDEKPAAPTGTMLTLGSMPNGGDPFSGSSGSGAYSQTFAVGGQIAIIYKNTSNESVKVVTDALTAADISNEGKTATINVSIDDADKTQGVTYIYPAAMANDDGTINCDFINQDGTVTAIYSGSGDWDGDALSSATMESQQNIVKFTLQDNGGNALSASSLTISAASKKLVASKGFIIKSTTHSGYTYDGGTSSEYGEAPSYIVDGKKTSGNHSKWCTNAGDKVNGIWYCEFHTASAVQVNGYTITTGNDNAYSNNRNPKDWVLKAKAKETDPWTTIATVTNDATLKDENYQSFDFNVDVHGIYQYFRFEVSATRGADVMQIEELELFKSNYGSAYGDLTVTPASATSEIFVALRNENGSADTYTVSANVGGKKYAFSKGSVTFQNGKYYEITVKMTEQTASTVTWNFSEMSGENPRLFRGYTYKDVTLSGDGDLNFGHGSLMSMGSDLTFTAPTNKHFKKIVFTATGIADIRGTGWTNGGNPGNYTSTWTGDASSVTFSGMADGVTSIVFTLE